VRSHYVDATGDGKLIALAINGILGALGRIQATWMRELQQQACDGGRTVRRPRYKPWPLAATPTGKIHKPSLAEAFAAKGHGTGRGQ
jgi:hypothetical protein